MFGESQMHSIKETQQSPQWFAYRHINGEIHIKRYFNRADITGAMKSDFVKDLLGPFAANSRTDAYMYADTLLID